MDVRFLAVHTTTQFNPRALLSWERAQGYNLTQPSRRAGAHDRALQLTLVLTLECAIRLPICSERLSHPGVTGAFVVDVPEHEPGCHLHLCVCRQMLRNTWVATLNAAMRHIARRDNLPLVDLETLHLQLPVEHVYRVDGFHPRSNLLIQVCLNLLLNMYEQSTGSSVLGDA